MLTARCADRTTHTGSGAERLLRAGVVAMSLLALSACATIESPVSEPNVSLRNLSIESLDMDKQTFRLNFDVSNPNPFPLPINRISYGVELDGHRFASGEANCEIVVPAGSDGVVEISVDLNLLQTAPKLLFVVRDASRREIPYQLEGRMDLDIPLSPRVPFSKQGNIQLQAFNYAP